MNELLLLLNEFPDKPWDWNALSENPNITMEFVMANNPTTSLIRRVINALTGKKTPCWRWYWLSQNPNVTMEFIRNHPDLPWDWTGISWNLNLTMEFLKGNLDRPWHWYRLSQNQNVTLEYLRCNLDLPWDWDGLSQNQNVTMEFVRDNPDIPWSWYWLSQNNFNYDKKALLDAVYTVQEFSQNWLWKPECEDSTLCVRLKLDTMYLGL